jgi:hypothetical protein
MSAHLDPGNLIAIPSPPARWERLCQAQVIDVTQLA